MDDSIRKSKQVLFVAGANSGPKYQESGGENGFESEAKGKQRVFGVNESQK
jgi:hypothetical protein